MLNNIGLPGLLLIAIVVLVLFGRGKISTMMGEVGKGITSFRRGMDDGRRDIEDADAARARDVTPSDAAATSTSAGVPPASVAATPVSPDRRDLA